MTGEEKAAAIARLDKLIDELRQLRRELKGTRSYYRRKAKAA